MIYEGTLRFRTVTGERADQAIWSFHNVTEPIRASIQIWMLNLGLFVERQPQVSRYQDKSPSWSKLQQLCSVLEMREVRRGQQGEGGAYS